MIFRQAEHYLRKWHRSRRRKPLVLRGARQVGKSALVRQFASDNKIAIAEINLERHLYLDAVFKSLDPDRIIYELEAVAGQKVNSGETILFLDEIQGIPHAIQALRYFYEEKSYIPVVGAGSLLDLVPKGRDEGDLPWKMAWIRHHDKYDE
jgi:predicted AAA+ superfamily ATPase